MLYPLNFRSIGLVLGACFLASCALNPPPAQVAAKTPQAWQAPIPEQIPHDGKIGELNRWWSQLGDPTLVQLIVASQDASPTLATARTRVAQARANRVSAQAALSPSLDGTASASRGFNQQIQDIATVGQAGVQASWELDVFGANAANRDASQLRYRGAQAQWHEARVSVAAETANTYFDYRTCEELYAVAKDDANSLAQTSKLTDEATRAGFRAPATAALARASAATASGRLTQQRAQCDVLVKSIVALTAIEEPQLRQMLSSSGLSATSVNLDSAAFGVSTMPAKVIEQRPDVFAAETEVAAASASVGVTQAQRYPRLTLTGSIGANYIRTAGQSSNFNTWSIGPLSLTVPLFDGGVIAANEDAAIAQYEEAVAQYKASVRRAVSEVEQSFVNLTATQSRLRDAQISEAGYRESFTGTQALYDAGLASLLELEETRRTRLAATNTLVSLQRERISAWISLYRAAGGGWMREGMNRE